MPKVSILLPVYNGETYLAACLQSLLNQTFTDFEVWIGDDGSRDRTLEILARYDDRRLHLVQHPQNLGLFGNLQNLATRATGEILRFLCQDDVLLPHCLAEEVAFYESHPEVGIAFPKFQSVDAQGQVIAVAALRDLPAVCPISLSVQLLYYHGCIAANLSPLSIRHRVFQEIGGFDITMGISGDYDLLSRAAVRYPLGVIHQHLLQVRSHARQLSRSAGANLRCLQENQRIRALLAPHLPAGLWPHAQTYLRQRHHVLAVHSSLRLHLLRGDWAGFWAIVQTLGHSEFAIGLLFWLLSANNRLWRPQPRFLAGA
ncbi:MAG: glycosyltransferase [Pseudanabaenaceae cyanobacterium]